MPIYRPDGTIQVTAGDTLSGIYGQNWKQASGYSGDPRQLQVGTILPGIQNSAQVMPQQSSAQVVPQQPSAQIVPQQPSAMMGVRGPVLAAPSMARGGVSQTPQEINYTMASVNSNATPQGVGNSELWNKVVKGAQQAQAKYGVPASITIAQFFQETGGGRHFVGNNLFGLKGQGPAGSVKALTWEQGPNGPYQTYGNFRAYKNVEESVEDHARLLVENPAYKKFQALIASGDQNPDNYADALQGVYATDPNYSNALKSLTRKHDLVQYDFDNTNKIATPINSKSGSSTTAGATGGGNGNYASMNPAKQSVPTSIIDKLNQNMDFRQQPLRSSEGMVESRFQPGAGMVSGRTDDALFNASRQMDQLTPPLMVQLPQSNIRPYSIQPTERRITDLSKLRPGRII